MSSTRKLNKTQRKLKKFQNVVYKETGVICNLTPSKDLVICNTGLVNGLSEETVLEHFSKCGILENISLLPGKSCCFISYKELGSAVQAFDHYNGTLYIAQDNKPIYLLYADSLPSFPFNKVWNRFPPGLMILENFITSEEENDLLKLHDFNISMKSAEQMKHRQVKHYGFEFRYDTNNIDKDKPLKDSIPKQCNFLWERLHNTNGINFFPNQLTINHYSPGQGIPHHVDTHSAFEDPIMALSLQSSVVMDFKKENENICVVLPRRSMAIMSGECRYSWTHGITPRKFDIICSKNGFTTLEREIRVSFTFRKILQGDCNCIYKEKCDSHNRTVDFQMEDSVASELEKLHVQKVYENIASHFNDTRHKPWPNVLEFVKSFEKGSILVDIGCGNGKYLGLNKEIFGIGCDSSFGLMDVCKGRGFEVFMGNCMNLPLKDNSADGVISIAVIHHLATEERRFRAIEEMVRILKLKGMALVYVWAKDQLKDKQKSSYIKQTRKNRIENEDTLGIAYNENQEIISNDFSLPVHVNRTQFKHKDILVPWKLKSNDKHEDTFFRYYHVFEERELENLCRRLNNIEIVKYYYDQGNWCIIIRKCKK